MVQIPYIHTETFKIRTSEINHLKEIHAFALIQLMQEASMQHTIGMKVSVWDMEALKAGWVLLKMEVNFYHYPTLNERVTIKTYPSGLEGYFTFRDYLVYSEDGTLCASASSMWTMFNTETRKMVKIPEHFGTLVYKDAEPLPKPDKKLLVPEAGTSESNVTVNYFHLDWNGHVNNVQLIRLMMESLNNELLVNNKLLTLSLQFKTEAMLSQQLTFVHQPVGKQTFIHAIRDLNSGKDVVLAQSEWLPR